MTTPRYADCRCGHTRAAHDTDEMRPQCIRTGCTCLQYRPNTGASTPTRPATGPAMNITTPNVDNTVQLIETGKSHDIKSIVNLANKIDGLLTDLRNRIAADREAARVRAEIADLHAKLDAAKAKLPRPAQNSGSTRGSGDKECPDCGKTGLSNVGVHRRFAHGVKAAS